MITVRRLNHAVLFVSDLNRAMEFYCTVLGMKVIAREPGPSYRAVGEAPLTRGGSGWKAAEATFRRPEGKAVELCIENTSVGEGNTVWVRKIEIAEVK